MLRIHDLNKSYGKFQALKDINIEMDKGIFGLLGPNGAGKTTLMRCIATLINDFTGEIEFNDVLWSKSKERDIKRLIGYLPQSFTAYNNLTVIEFLRHVQLLKRGNLYIEELDEVIDKVNMRGNMHKRIKSLSGGMLRRVGIAQAIVGKPEILIIDEPTAGLDPMERIRFKKLISELSKDNIIILSTHIIEDLEDIASNIAFIKEGEIVHQASVKSIMDDLSKLGHKSLSAAYVKYIGDGIHELV